VLGRAWVVEVDRDGKRENDTDIAVMWDVSVVVCATFGSVTWGLRDGARGASTGYIFVEICFSFNNNQCSVD
jgi:hypothetical protein